MWGCLILYLGLLFYVSFLLGKEKREPCFSFVEGLQKKKIIRKELICRQNVYRKVFRRWICWDCWRCTSIYWSKNKSYLFRACVLGSFSYLPLFATLWTSPLSMGLSRQEYWSELPFPPPGDLLDPGIKPAFLMSSALAGGFRTRELIRIQTQVYLTPT